MTRRASRRAGPLLAAFALAATLTGCAMADRPPESEYTQAEAYAPMERAAAETVDAIPDFPGFGQRSWAELPCSRNGMDDEGYTNIEIRYRFSLEDSGDPTVRDGYVEVLREHWTSLGYEIYLDDPTKSEDRSDHELAARRDDGVSLRYAVGGYAGLFVNSGCVPVSDVREIEYLPPAGGIVPGSARDLVAHDSRYFPDGVPAERLTADAIDPFASGPAGFSDEPPAPGLGHSGIVGVLKRALMSLGS